MEFRRINGLPPYVFAHIDALKLAARRAGTDVVDLGFGNPDLPSPDVAVEKLAEAVHNPRNHRYSASQGIPKLRQAISSLYLRRFGVELDPETEVVTTIGAKEGMSHLMWVLLGPGDSALVPSPSYPIHIYAPALRRRRGAPGPPGGPRPTIDGARRLPRRSSTTSWTPGNRPGPSRASSCCRSPTTPPRRVSTWPGCSASSTSPVSTTSSSCTTSPTPTSPSTATEPPSILQVPGAKDVAVELYSLTKSFSMAGWRVAFLVGNAEIVQALTKLKSYLDYGTFQPIQIAAIVAMNEAPDYPKWVNETYLARRDALCDGLNRIGWSLTPPKGTMFVWAPIPEPYREMGSLEFSSFLVSEAEVATSPGVGFGPGGDGHVRFALIENEQRIGQAVRNLRKTLTKLH